MEDFSVLFVHGLGSTCGADFRILKSKLSDCEPRIPEPNLHPFNYKSRKHRLKFSLLGRSTYPTLPEIARSLENEIGQITRSSEALYIISYSLGGVLTKAALSLSSDNYLKRRIAGLIDIAVPEDGSDIANAANFLGISSEASKDLSVGSEFLTQLANSVPESFLSQVRNLKLFGLNDRLVRVPQQAPPHQDHYVIQNADHSSILMFDPENNSFQKLLSFLHQGENSPSVFMYGDHSGREFSPTIRDAGKEINQKIEKLTTEQQGELEKISNSPRAFVEGCAGSGKTLLAAEKAIRLAKAKVDTALFCHSPILAKKIRHYVGSTPNLSVFCFSEFVQYVQNTARDNNQKGWNEFEFPTSDEILGSIPLVEANPSLQFSAIIVDEGQEFEDDWLDFLEMCLVNPSTNPIVVFFDRNQRIGRGKLSSRLPIGDLNLTTNIRNGGAIFRCVNALYPSVSHSHPELEAQGNIGVFDYGLDHQRSLREALIDAESQVGAASLVVLTNETCGIDNSILNGMTFHRHRENSWQLGMLDVLNKIRSSVNKELEQSGQNEDAAKVRSILLPQFQNDPSPTRADISAVENYKRRIQPFINQSESSRGFRVAWRPHGRKLVPMFYSSFFSRFDPSNKAEREFRRLKTAEAFRFIGGSWSDTLPSLPTFKIKPYHLVSDGSHIPLYSVNQYKGCEADGVVLFVQSVGNDLPNVVYTGLSRARICLNLVILPDPRSKISSVIEQVSDSTGSISMHLYYDLEFVDYYYDDE